MKKVLKLLGMVIATSIILVGCGQSNNKKQNGDQDMDNKDNVQDITWMM